MVWDGDISLGCVAKRLGITALFLKQKMTVSGYQYYEAIEIINNFYGPRIKMPFGPHILLFPIFLFFVFAFFLCLLA